MVFEIEMVFFDLGFIIYDIIRVVNLVVIILLLFLLVFEVIDVNFVLINFFSIVLMMVSFFLVLKLW